MLKRATSPGKNKLQENKSGCALRFTSRVPAGNVFGREKPLLDPQTIDDTQRNMKEPERELWRAKAAQLETIK